VLQAPDNGYRTGKVLAHGFGPDPQAPDYTLLQGDITEAYSKKVKQVTRSFVFLNLRDKQVPAALVVLDRVVSTDPAFQKYWLLHCLEEPKVESSRAVVDCTLRGARGRLNLDILLPSADNLTLSKVGGPGKEFWVFGTNYENNVEPARLERGSMEPGAWRLEVCPRQAAAEDLFLNVVQVSDRKNGAHWPVSKLEAEGRTGCLITGSMVSWLVLLRRDGTRSDQEVRFRVPGPNPCRVLVTDLSPGRWRAERAGAARTLEVEVTAEAGAAWLEAEAGAWTLRR
jgi:heparin/heparan-sulfate lyase